MSCIFFCICFESQCKTHFTSSSLQWKPPEPDWLQIDSGLSVAKGLLRINQQNQESAKKLYYKNRTETQLQGRLIYHNPSEMWWRVATPSVILFLFFSLSWYFDFLHLSHFSQCEVCSVGHAKELMCVTVSHFSPFRF